MATDISPPQAWIDILETLENGLCYQMGLENVVYNFTSLLEDDVVERLRTEPDANGEVLIENENFNTNVLVRRNLWGTKTFDEAKQNAADLESTLLGFSSAQMGNRTTTRPFDNGPVGQVLPNKDSWFFYFRYEERNIRVVNSRISSEGLRNPSIGNWLEKRLLSPKPTYASLDSNDLATLLFFNRFTTNTQIIPELDEASANPYTAGSIDIFERDSEIISGLIREIRPGLTQASPAPLDRDWETIKK